MAFNLSNTSCHHYTVFRGVEDRNLCKMRPCSVEHVKKLLSLEHKGVVELVGGDATQTSDVLITWIDDEIQWNCYAFKILQNAELPF